MHRFYRARLAERQVFLINNVGDVSLWSHPSSHDLSLPRTIPCRFKAFSSPRVFSRSFFCSMSHDHAQRRISSKRWGNLEAPKVFSTGPKSTYKTHFNSNSAKRKDAAVATGICNGRKRWGLVEYWIEVTSPIAYGVCNKSTCHVRPMLQSHHLLGPFVPGDVVNHKFHRVWAFHNVVKTIEFLPLEWWFRNITHINKSRDILSDGAGNKNSF